MSEHSYSRCQEYQRRRRTYLCVEIGWIRNTFGVAVLLHLAAGEHDRVVVAVAVVGGVVLDAAAVELKHEVNVLFNDALKTFHLRLYGVRHMVKDHSDSERGNLLLPHYEGRKCFI